MRHISKTAHCLALATGLFITAAAPPPATAAPDPELVFSTYLGGSGFEETAGLTVDAFGNAYLVGTTFSSDFPADHVYGPTGDGDVFVAKLAPDGTLLFSAIIGGSRQERGVDIDVSPSGLIWVTGETSSPDFPENNPFMIPFQGFRMDAFVAALTSDGSFLAFADNIGGAEEHERGLAIAAGLGFEAYVAVDFTLGTAGAVYRVESGFIESTSIQWEGPRGVTDLDVDPTGHLLLVGGRSGSECPDANFEGIFVERRRTPSLEVVYALCLGGAEGDDRPLAVAGDPAGRAWVTGFSGSLSFPTPGQNRPGVAAFLLIVAPEGEVLAAELFGGSRWNQGSAIAVAGDRAAIAGFTDSPDFPVTESLAGGCAGAAGGACGEAAFVTLFDNTGRLLASTLFGGSGNDRATGVGIDPRNGEVVIGGQTSSPDLPVVAAAQPTYGGAGDAFVARIAFNRPPDCSAAVASPAVLWPPNGKLVPVSVRGVTDPDGDPVAITITSVTQDEPLTGPFDASGVGGSTALLRASRAGRGDGRVYRVGFEADDGSDGTCAGTVTVCVPHDRRPGGGCRDGGALVGSTGS